MTINKANKKHDSYICSLADELVKDTRIKDVYTNVVYELGECDIWIVYNAPLEEYIEVKCNDTVKGYKKALDQLTRWCDYMQRMDKNKAYDGRYWTPTYQRLVIKDGKRV